MYAASGTIKLALLTIHITLTQYIVFENFGELLLWGWIFSLSLIPSFKLKIYTLSHFSDFVSVPSQDSFNISGWSSRVVSFEPSVLSCVSISAALQKKAQNWFRKWKKQKTWSWLLRFYTYSHFQIFMHNPLRLNDSAFCIKWLHW